MATFEIIGGDFGEGKRGQILLGALYRESGQGFQMPMAGRVFKREHIPKGHIETLEIATAENLKKMGGAVGWGVVGALALGPVGALAGVLAGGRKQEVTFVCKFRDGRRFLGRCDTKTFTEVQAAYIGSDRGAQLQPARGNVANVAAVENATPCREGRHYACGYKSCPCNCHLLIAQNAYTKQSGKAARVVPLFVGLLVLGVIGYGIRAVFRTSPNEPKSAPLNAGGSSSLNQQSLHFAALHFADDLEDPFYGSGKPSLTRAQAISLAHIDLFASASALEAAYDANEVAADAKYKGKKLLITGVIASIDKDFKGDAYLTLSSGSFTGMQAELNGRGALGAAKLERGNRVYLMCNSVQRVIGSEIVSDCEHLNQYVEGEIFNTVQDEVAKFLEGKLAFPMQEGKTVAFLYQVGLHLPSYSACFIADEEKPCATETNRVLNDKALVKQIREDTERLLARVRLN